LFGSQQLVMRKENEMNDGNSEEETPLVLLAETESYAVLVSEEEDGVHIYDIELGNLTLHLYQEEWDELVELLNAAQRG
jgi:hypothetical protein